MELKPGLTTMEELRVFENWAEENIWASERRRRTEKMI
jgi:hypothetical protein